jgi:hypothetical protein
MTYSPRIVCTDTCVHFITKAGNGIQVCNPLGILDRGRTFLDDPFRRLDLTLNMTIERLRKGGVETV